MAADSPTPGTETLPWCNLPICPEPGEHRITTGRCLLVPAAPSPTDTTEPPAEAQQDDERSAAQIADEHNIASLLYNDSQVSWADAQANAVRVMRYLAARPSADTETLAGLITYLQGRRRETLVALRACIGADADYWRWQGHAELSRQLLERLGAEVPR